MKNKRKIRNLKFALLFLLIALVITAFIFEFLLPKKEYHVHADFKVYLNGSFINFSQDKYQSTLSKVLHESVHLHDGNGDVIHHHAQGINLSTFFNSLGMQYTIDCFTDDMGNQYCDGEPLDLVTVVNGVQIDNGPEYIFKDLDRILIAYVDPTEDLDALIAQVTDKACIESAICPERGSPSEGSCVTGQTCIVDPSDFN